jgi:hypothetical protein
LTQVKDGYWRFDATCNAAVADVGSHDNTTFGAGNGSLNSKDSRMQQVSHADGKL